MFKVALRLAVSGAALLVVILCIGCGGSSEASANQSRLSDICQQTTDGDADYCKCVADAVIASGYDTKDEINQLEALVSTIDDTGNVASLPPPVASALDGCGTTGPA